MTVTLELSPERELALKAEAQAQGLTVEQWLLELAGHYRPAESITHLQRSDSEEWARRFHEWAENHDRTTPLLGDDAISRESIYPDRI